MCLYVYVVVCMIICVFQLVSTQVVIFGFFSVRWSVKIILFSPCTAVARSQYKFRNLKQQR